MPERPIRVPRPALTAIVALILAALTGTGVIEITDNSQPPTPTPTATVGDDSYGTGLGPATSAAPAPEVIPIGETHLRDPNEPTLPRTLAAPAAPAPVAGCRVQLNTANFSVRTARVRNIAAHYTVSREIPDSWADTLGVARFLNLPSTQASAGFIIDRDGHCLYTVPVRLKAWHVAAGNSFSVGIEFIGMGDEGGLSPAALREGGQVISRVAGMFGIPLQIGDVTGCTPRRAGLVDHAMYGACGGGHHDIRPYYDSHVVPDPRDNAKVLWPLLSAAKGAREPTAHGKALACLEHERRIARRHGGWSHIDPLHLRRARACKAQLT